MTRKRGGAKGKKGGRKPAANIRSRPRSRTRAKGKDAGKGKGRPKAKAKERKAQRLKPVDGRLGLVTQWRRRKATRPKEKEAAFKRPDDAVIVEAIREILIKHRVVHSQEDLRDLVMERLAARDPMFKVGGERIRHIALDMPEVKVHVDLRIVEEGVGHTKCPVCDSSMRPDKNQTVYGGVVTTGFSCPRCGYRTGLKHRSPTRYTFSLKGGGSIAQCPAVPQEGADITSFGTETEGGDGGEGGGEGGTPGDMERKDGGGKDAGGGGG